MSQTLRPGQAVYIHHLHENRPARVIEGPDEQGEHTFQLEGKVRRMLVIAVKPRIRVESVTDTQRPTGKNNCMFYEARGHLGYLVLSLQSNPPPGHWLPYEGLLDPDRTSYIELRPIWYPRESIAQGTGFRNVAPDVLDQIRKELSFENLGYDWDRA